MGTLSKTFLIILCYMIAAALWAISSNAQTDADIAECVVIPRSQVNKAQCDCLGPHYDVGCSQRMAKRDPADNWSSRDYPHSGAGMGFTGGCDIPSEKAHRGANKVRFSNGDQWVVMKQVVFPASAGRLFAPINPMAVPGDTMASSSKYFEWQCDDTSGGGLHPHDGSYVRQWIWGPQASNFELNQFSEWDFRMELDYWDAYGSCRDGYLDLTGTAHNNNQPGTPASVINGWKKRFNIMDQVAHGPVNNPKPIPMRMAEVGTQIAEYYLQRYGYNDMGRLAAIGLWTWEDQPLYDAITHFFDLTSDPVCGVLCDPDMIFNDVDVPLAPTTVGAVKRRYLGAGQ